MKKYILDVESTIFKKGNPFSRKNKLVLVGLLDHEEDTLHMGMDKDFVQSRIHNSILIGFNIKFDLHWLRRWGIDISTIRVWDCQLAHFILRGQETPFPSLNQVALFYGLGTKLDVVESEYWDKGIDTDQIPFQILEEYLEQDLTLTGQIQRKQLEEFRQDPLLYKLFQLHCKDLLVLEDMEYNGMFFDTEKARQRAEQIQQKIHDIEEELRVGYEQIPINFQSRDHLSCYLYGGTLTVEDRMPIGVYKTGAKAGQTRFKKIEYTFKLPRLFEPIEGSELAKDGYYSTDEGTLRTLRGSKEARKKLDLLLERSKSSKLLGTYYRGIPELIEEMDWPDGELHGNFNQCVAATGRLSSSKPNLQNFAGDIDELLPSRYGFS